MCVCKVCRWRRTSRPSHTHTSTRNNRLILIVYVRVCICRPWSAIQCSRVEEPPGQKNIHTSTRTVCRERSRRKKKRWYISQPPVPPKNRVIDTDQRERQESTGYRSFSLYLSFLFFPLPIYTYISLYCFCFSGDENEWGGGDVLARQEFFFFFFFCAETKNLRWLLQWPR